MTRLGLLCGESVGAKAEAERPGGKTTNFYVHADHLGVLLNTDLDSVGVGWYLRHCILNKLAGEHDTPSTGHTWVVRV